MKYAMKHLRAGLLALFALISAFAIAADWPSFRGPQGLGTSDGRGLPATWSAGENVVWRTELPGPGTSSPITVGNRIYLTSYSGYALSVESPGDMSQLMRHVVCLDAATGKVIWQKEFKPQLPESEYSGGNNTWHGYASCTPASDGKALYVFLGKSGVYALDLNDGAEKWHTDVGSQTTGWGSGNSVVLTDKLVIINASIESSSLRALSKKDGSEVWRVDSIRGARNTPLLVNVPGKSSELVLSLPGSPQGLIVSYNPETGAELWRCKGIPDAGYVCPSLVAHEGIVYAIGGRKNTALAVRAGGSGDVTDTNLLWSTAKGSNVASPAYYQGHLYWVHEKQGIAYCLEAQTGEVKFEKRLEPRPGIVYSSILVADGKVYAISQHDGTFVFAAKPDFEFLAHNTFADDESRTNACLVVYDNKLLLRNDKYLYCLGKK